MSEIAVRNAPLAQLRSALSDESLAQIEAALDPSVSPERFLQVANTAALTNPDLVQADRASLFVAVLKCAQTGLLPDGEEAALVAYKGKVSFLPMIGGFRKIAADFGWDLRGYVVYENDEEFRYELGESPTVVHRPARLGTDRGKKIGAYAIATHRDGRKKLEVMDAAQVEAIKAKASNKQLWNGSTEPRMWEKTPAKSLFKRGSLGVGVKEVDRIRALLAESTDLPADDLLYGRKTLAAVSATDADAQAAGGDRGPQAVPESPSGAAPGFDYSSLAGDEVPASNDGTPAPSASGDAGRNASPAPAENISATLAPDSTRYAGQTLAEIALVDGGEAWLLDVLTKVPAGDPFRDAVEAFVQATLPAVWKAYCEARYGSGS